MQKGMLYPIIATWIIYCMLARRGSNSYHSGFSKIVYCILVLIKWLVVYCHHKEKLHKMNNKSQKIPSIKNGTHSEVLVASTTKRRTLKPI